MFTTYFFKFADEAEAKQQLAEYLDANGNWITDSYDHCLSIVGTISKPDGTFDDEGNANMAALPGYHVNIRLKESPADLAAYLVYPESPVRV
jgi:hypothetical protein